MKELFLFNFKFYIRVYYQQMRMDQIKSQNEKMTFKSIAHANTQQIKVSTQAIQQHKPFIFPSHISCSYGDEPIAAAYALCHSQFRKPLNNLIKVDQDYFIRFADAPGQIRLVKDLLNKFNSSFSSEVIKHFNTNIPNKQFHDSLIMKNVLEQIAKKNNLNMKSNILNCLSSLPEELLYSFLQTQITNQSGVKIILFYNRMIFQLISLDGDNIKLKNLIEQSTKAIPFSQFYNKQIAKLQINQELDYEQIIAKRIYFKMKEFTIGLFQIQQNDNQNLFIYPAKLLKNKLQEKWKIIDMIYSEDQNIFATSDKEQDSQSLKLIYNSEQLESLSELIKNIQQLDFQPVLNFKIFFDFIKKKYFKEKIIIKLAQKYKQSSSLKTKCFLMFIPFFSQHSQWFQNAFYRVFKLSHTSDTRLQIWLKIFEELFKRQADKLVLNQNYHQTFISSTFQGNFSSKRYQYFSFGKNLNLQYLRQLVNQDTQKQTVINCQYKDKFCMYIHGFKDQIRKQFNKFIVSSSEETEGSIESYQLSQIQRQCIQRYQNKNFTEKQMFFLSQENYALNRQRRQFENSNLLNITIYYPSENEDIIETLNNLDERQNKFLQRNQYLGKDQSLKDRIVQIIGQKKNLNQSYKCEKKSIKKLNLQKYQKVLNNIGQLAYYSILLNFTNGFGMANQTHLTLQFTILLLSSLLRKQHFEQLYTFIKPHGKFILQGKHQELKELLKHLILKQKLTIKVSQTIQIILKQFLINYFLNLFQSNLENDKFPAIITKIMKNHQYQLIKIQSDRIPNLQFLQKLFSNIQNSLQKNQILEQQLDVFVATKNQAFTIIDNYKQYFTIKQPNNKNHVVKEYFEIFQPIVENFIFKRLDQQYLEMEIYFLYIPKEYIPKEYNGNKGTGNLFKQILKNAIKQTEKDKKICDFNFKYIDVKGIETDPKNTRPITNKNIFQTPKFNEHQQIERLSQSNKKLNNKASSFFMSLFWNSEKRIIYKKLNDWLDQNRQQISILYKPFMQKTVGVQKTMICVIVTAFNSLLKINKKLLQKIFTINLVDNLIQFNYFQQVNNHICQKYKPNNIYESISEHYYRIIKDNCKQQDISCLFNTIFKNALVTMFHRLLTNFQGNGFNIHNVIKLMLGQQYYSIQFIFITNRMETDFQKIVSYFIKFTKLKQFEKYEKFMTFRYKGHCSRLLDQEYYFLPEEDRPSKIPYDDIKEQKIKIKLTQHKTIEGIKLKLDLHLIKNNILNDIKILQEKVLLFQDSLRRNKIYIPSKTMQQEQKGVISKLYIIQNNKLKK